MQWIQNGQSSGSCVFDVLFLKWPTRTNTQRDRHSLLRIRFLCIRCKLEYFKVGFKFRTSHCDKDETNRNGNAIVRRRHFVLRFFEMQKTYQFERIKHGTSRRQNEIEPKKGIKLHSFQQFTQRHHRQIMFIYRMWSEMPCLLQYLSLQFCWKDFFFNLLSRRNHLTRAS